MSQTYKRVFASMPKTHYGHACKNRRNVEALKITNREIDKMFKELK